MKVREAFNRTIQAELEQTRSVAKEAKDVVREARSTMDEVVTATPAPKQSNPPPADEAAASSTPARTEASAAAIHEVARD